MEAEYTAAAKDMRHKLNEQLKEYGAENKRRLAALDGSPDAKEAYKLWLQEQTRDNIRMASMVDSLSHAANTANEKAAQTINDTLPVIYAENANRAAYAVDSALRIDTRFALVDEDTVRHVMQAETPLIRETVWFMKDPHLKHTQDVRKAQVDKAKDMRWNRQKFQSAITQGILQGESIPNIVKRTDSIFGMNLAAANRACRTACTSAENAGRVSSYERALDLGIELEKQWLATLDGRTRDSHRALDGQHVPIDKPFEIDGERIEYPGDPAAPGHLVWNCRCTLVAWFPDIEQHDPTRWSKLPKNTTYEKWKAGKEAEDGIF